MKKVIMFIMMVAMSVSVTHANDISITSTYCGSNKQSTLKVGDSLKAGKTCRLVRWWDKKRQICARRVDVGIAYTVTDNPCTSSIAARTTGSVSVPLLALGGLVTVGAIVDRDNAPASPD